MDSNRTVLIHVFILPLFLLAAGGTGGHVFLAEALARELLARNARVGLVTDSVAAFSAMI